MCPCALQVKRLRKQVESQKEAASKAAEASEQQLSTAMEPLNNELRASKELLKKVDRGEGGGKGVAGWGIYFTVSHIIHLGIGYQIFEVYNSRDGAA